MSFESSADWLFPELYVEKKPLMIRREWAMPNRKTFSIKPIYELAMRYVSGVVVDPFSADCKIGTITNDLDTSCGAMFNMEATDFLKTLASESADVVLYDPPYSPRQVAECYRRSKLSVNMQTTQSSYWAMQKREIARIVKHGGVCITCSWNSGGIGKEYGFDMVEILLVAHGGWHNDTIVTVERKRKK